MQLIVKAHEQFVVKQIHVGDLNKEEMLCYIELCRAMQRYALLVQATFEQEQEKIDEAIRRANKDTQ